MFNPALRSPRAEGIEQTDRRLQIPWVGSLVQPLLARYSTRGQLDHWITGGHCPMRHCPDCKHRPPQTVVVDLHHLLFVSDIDSMCQDSTVVK
ncbi:hypothetical protein RRG08_048387 [Elysia crispata]|uniref:Uncharacterized protein n=1 Tax=Elysia crispata TaxID=231223 RepID=A0AAE1B922_9GAST|nr:hypothetical protein RRG08_048387 [Elysia crispata]